MFVNLIDISLESNKFRLNATIREMSENNEYHYAEVAFEKLALESLPEEQSAYYETKDERERRRLILKLGAKLKWHIRNSLSERQREVIELILKGKTEREIAEILGIAQQVVHIYKRRAINSLQNRITE